MSDGIAIPDSLRAQQSRPADLVALMPALLDLAFKGDL